jgi:hypothetical protein
MLLALGHRIFLTLQDPRCPPQVRSLHVRRRRGRHHGTRRWRLRPRRAALQTHPARGACVRQALALGRAASGSARLATSPPSCATRGGFTRPSLSKLAGTSSVGHGLLLCDLGRYGEVVDSPDLGMSSVPLPHSCSIGEHHHRRLNPQDFRTMACVDGTIKLLTMEGFMEGNPIALVTFALDLDGPSLPGRKTRCCVWTISGQIRHLSPRVFRGLRHCSRC